MPSSKLRLARSKIVLQELRRNVYSRCDGILTPELWGEIERTMSDFLPTTVSAMVGDTEALAHGGICPP